MRVRVSVRLVGVVVAALVVMTGSAPAIAESTDELTVVSSGGTEDSPSIIGGERAKSGRGMAVVRRDGSMICSGTIIAARWVLTAKHCADDPGNYSVRVKLRLRAPGNGILRRVEAKHLHPKVDLALLRLESRVEDVRYMKLATENPQVDAFNKIKGWGCTEDSDPCAASRWLKQAITQVGMFTDDDVDDGRKRYFFSLAETGYGAPGDSGGAHLRLDNGRQNGVMSGQGGPCAECTYVVSVPTHLAWIRNYVPGAGG